MGDEAKIERIEMKDKVFDVPATAVERFYVQDYDDRARLTFFETENHPRAAISMSWENAIELARLIYEIETKRQGANDGR